MLNVFGISSTTTESLYLILKENFNKSNDSVYLRYKLIKKLINYFDKDEEELQNNYLKYFRGIGLSSLFQGNTKYINLFSRIFMHFGE